MGDMEAHAVDPDAWAVLLDVNGNLAEGTGSNIFLVRDGRLYTPQERYVLPGISRRVVMDLAEAEGIPLVEADLTCTTRRPRTRSSSPPPACASARCAASTATRSEPFRVR